MLYFLELQDRPQYLNLVVVYSMPFLPQTETSFIKGQMLELESS